MYQLECYKLNLQLNRFTAFKSWRMALKILAPTLDDTSYLMNSIANRDKCIRLYVLFSGGHGDLLIAATLPHFFVNIQRYFTI